MKSKEKLMKLIQAPKFVIRLTYVGLILILSLGCQNKKESLYILFEPNKLHMNIYDDNCYKFWINEEEYILFTPKEQSLFLKQNKLNHKIVDIKWLSQTYQDDYLKIMKSPSIFIVERSGLDSLKITPVIPNEGTE
ncbi:MAG: hypothetical protein WAO52_01745 [Prolixibacteraceae bacterium]